MGDMFFVIVHACQAPREGLKLLGLIKVTKGLAPDSAWHTTSAELGSHQPHLFMGREKTPLGGRALPVECHSRTIIWTDLSRDYGGFAVSFQDIPSTCSLLSSFKRARLLGLTSRSNDIHPNLAALSFIRLYSLHLLISDTHILNSDAAAFLHQFIGIIQPL